MAIAGLTQFLCSWFGTFPLHLPDLTGRLSAEARYGKNPAEVKPVNKAVRKREKKISLQSSDTAPTVLGGVCTNEMDFHGAMKRYFRESFPDILRHVFGQRPMVIEEPDGAEIEVQTNILAEQSVKVLRHREIRYDHKCIVDDQQEGCDEPRGRYRSILNKDEFQLMANCFHQASCMFVQRTYTLDGVVRHLENLGHAVAARVDGLTVDLLPFQLQTLRWAIERELTPGGVQSYYWPKLPFVEQPGVNIFYNPILGHWAMSKPRLVRGGIIAEQMGMGTCNISCLTFCVQTTQLTFFVDAGKTIISLALILCNPAPPIPVNGTEQNMMTGEPFWDPHWAESMHEEKTGASKKRGSILSRGTLVVVRRLLDRVIFILITTNACTMC